MKKILYLILILTLLILTILFSYFLKKHTEISKIPNESFSKTKEIINTINEEEFKNVTIKIGNNIIKDDDLSTQLQVLETYSEEEKIKYNKENIFTESIEHFVVLEEAKKNNIDTSINEDIINNIANKMYENSDHTLSQNEYIEKWTKIQKENEIKNRYMADILMKIADNKLESNNPEVNRLMSLYQENKTVDNLKNLYNAYIESVISTYDIKIEINEKEIYRNYY